MNVQITGSHTGEKLPRAPLELHSCARGATGVTEMNVKQEIYKQVVRKYDAYKTKQVQLQQLLLCGSYRL
jgi:hypothetical protein